MYLVEVKIVWVDKVIEVYDLLVLWRKILVILKVSCNKLVVIGMLIIVCEVVYRKMMRVAIVINGTVMDV